MDSRLRRRQSFVDHELTHTIQYTQWGPLWFSYFPMLLLELPVELATDMELPDYGSFVSGEISPTGTLPEGDEFRALQSGANARNLGGIEQESEGGDRGHGFCGALQGMKGFVQHSIPNNPQPKSQCRSERSHASQIRQIRSFQIPTLSILCSLQ